MSDRPLCSICGRMIRSFDATYTDDGPVHLGCQSLTVPHDARPGGRRTASPDFQAPSLAQQEYVRQTSFCYATLFHKPKTRRVRPRYEKK